MNVDSYFGIGKSHKVCQDYSEAHLWVPDQNGHSKNGYAVVSDGCSSSPQTDIGSRILTRIYCRSLDWLDCKDDSFEEKILYAQTGSSILGLNPRALDATLLAASVMNDEYRVYAAGDGAIVRIYPDRMKVTAISYPSGAPYYLSYQLDENRRKSYKAQWGITRRIETWDVVGDEIVGNDISEINDENVYFTSGPVENMQAICIMSDGLFSFYKAEGIAKVPEPLPTSDVLRSMLAFKGYQGEFVHRRMNRFSKDCEKMNWHHADDLSIAVLAMENV